MQTLQPLRFAALAFFLLCATAAPAAADGDLATVYARYVASLYVDASDFEAAAQRVDGYAASLNASSCRWPDINYHDPSRADWSPAIHMDRVKGMSAMIGTPGSPRQGNKTLIAAVQCALGAWFSADFQCKNWWYNDIGVPMTLGEALLLLRPENVNSTLQQQAPKILNRANGDGETGANMAWEMNVQIMAGLFYSNATQVSLGFNTIYAQVKYVSQSQEGIQMDGSFHQHGPELLAGSYGAAFASTILGLLQFASGTRFYMPDDLLDIFAHLVLDGHAWMVIQQSFDYSVVGREITRPAGGHPCHFSPAQLRNVTGARASEFRRFADQLGGDPGTPPLVGFRHYPDSDFATQHRANWTASIRMFSNRTVNARCVNDEGKRDEHTADGLVNLYYDGHDYDGIFPAWDWQQLPGVTGAKIKDGPSCATTTQQTSAAFVGGVQGRNAGGATQALDARGVSALRTWVVGDVIAALATAVSGKEEGANVTLTAAQRLLRGPVTVQLAGAAQPEVLPAETHRWLGAKQLQWLHHDNTGYLCLDLGGGSRGSGGGPASTACPAVELIAANRTGNWSDIGVHSGSVTVAVLGLHLQMGSMPKGAAQGYVVLPAVAAEAMPAIAAAAANVSVSTAGDGPAVKVPSQGGSVMVASFQSDKGGAAGADLGDSWAVTVDQPCLVLVQEGGAGAPDANVTLAVSSHTAAQSAVTLTIARKLTCSDTAGRPLSQAVAVGGSAATKVVMQLPTGDLAGATVTAHCAPATGGGRFAVEA